MAFYWRLKDMPELRDMPAGVRREWWREALIRSRTPLVQWMLAACTFLPIILVRLLVHYRYGTELARLGVGLAVALVLAFAIERGYQQSRARQWLREHVPGLSGPDART